MTNLLSLRCCFINDHPHFVGIGWCQKPNVIQLLDTFYQVLQGENESKDNRQHKSGEILRYPGVHIRSQTFSCCLMDYIDTCQFGQLESKLNEGFDAIKNVNQNYIDELLDVLCDILLHQEKRALELHS